MEHYGKLGGIPMKKWQEICVSELLKKDLFLSSMHLERFQGMFELVKEQPFCTRGLCKDLFLVAWEQEKVVQMQEILKEMKERQEVDTTYLQQECKRLFPDTQYEQAMKQLFLEFLQKEDETPDEDILLGFSVTRIAIGDNALEASRVLDNLGVIE